MPNIDTSSIENFETMTAEEKLEAVLKLEIPESVDLSKYVPKETFDKKASEAASLSKQLKESNKSGSELQDALDKIAKLEKDNAIKDYTAKYMNLGYDAELAAETARAYADGDHETVFKNGEKHREALEKKIKEDLMNRTPKPEGAGGKPKEEDAAIAKAREIAKARHGGEKSYADIMQHYK